MSGMKEETKANEIERIGRLISQSLARVHLELRETNAVPKSEFPRVNAMKALSLSMLKDIGEPLQEALALCTAQVKQPQPSEIYEVLRFAQEKIGFLISEHDSGTPERWKWIERIRKLMAQILASPGNDVAVGPSQPEVSNINVPLNQRERDLLRYCRQELHQAELITDDEFVEMIEWGSNGPGGGSPSARRLEDYDELRAQLDALQSPKPSGDSQPLAGGEQEIEE